MLDLKLMQKNPDVVRESLEKRGSKIDVAEFAALDERRKALIGEVKASRPKRTRSGRRSPSARRRARTPRTCWRKWARWLRGPRNWMWS